ncbi:MAG: hypothetical protein MR208_01410, partial [Oscillospiraceae bacterium]|nr:hypothetical protein [Oscillospiraceae bacterium]
LRSTGKFLFVKQIQGRTSVRGNPVCALARQNTPVTFKCPERFTSLSSAQGTVSLALLCSYPLMAKGVTTKVTPFENFYCLMNNAQKRCLFLFSIRRLPLLGTPFFLDGRRFSRNFFLCRLI